MVLQEIMQSLDTPDDLIFDRFQETAFPLRPWAVRSSARRG